jgi:cholesterol transport system auxiliary component
MNRLLWAGLVLTVAFMSGCAAESTSMAFHDFGPAEEIFPSATNASQPLITVDAPTWLWDNRLRYRLLHRMPTQIGYYRLDQWVAAPPELLQQWFAANAKGGDYLLALELMNFEQRFQSSSEAYVVMSLKATVFSTNYKKKGGDKDFYWRYPCPSPNADGAIMAFRRLLKQVDSDLNAWLAPLTLEFKRDVAKERP